MLTVIIDARDGTDGLAALLAQLTAGAVDGIVREVRIVAAPDQPAIDLLCEDMGAEAHPTLADAARAARSETLLMAPASFRFRDGWIGSLNAHMAADGGPASVVGLGGGGLRRAPEGVLIARGGVAEADGADLKHLRRALGFGRRRIG
ncbi:hypothetical protein [Phenylobacterium sp.]|jgi:hypothetical protein|uniref:hypothetical protein n=1 Tax=Phenylobacterium sp. TaxID=1871053 RepID=UPI0037CA35D6